MDTRRVSLFLAFILLVVVLTGSSYAIPAFSRQYGTSCTTCHIDFPKLNDFGKAFKDAGFKFPKGDEDFLKIPPVLLGAPAQKELWPHTVFPGVIPGILPVGLRFNQFFQYTPANANNYNVAGSSTSPYIPRTDFEPGFFSIFTAGNFGSGIAFWVDDDISVSGKNANGTLGDGYLKFVDLGRFFKLPTDALSLRVGQFELDLPVTQARNINLSGYDIFTEANFGVLGQQNVNNTFAIQNSGHGVEFSGGHQYGGYHYSLAIVDQNTSGNPASPSNVSSPAGFFSDANYKDLYARFSYRFNLESDPASRHDIQAAGSTGPRDHTYLSLGTFYFKGRSVQRFAGVDASNNATVLVAREPFYRVGGDFSFNYRTFNLFGVLMYGHDDNLQCQSATGPAPGCPGSTNGFAPGSAARFNGGFLEADYLVLPWMMTIMRYDRVQSSADFVNATNGGSTNYFLPIGSTRNRVTPGVQFLIHANIKTSFEYAIRPQQALTYNGTQVVSPFRTNTATGAIEFVY